MGEGGCRGTHTLRPQVVAGQGRENDAIKKHGEKKRLRLASMQIGARIFIQLRYPSVCPRQVRATGGRTPGKATRACGHGQLL